MQVQTALETEKMRLREHTIGWLQQSNQTNKSFIRRRRTLTAYTAVKQLLLWFFCLSKTNFHVYSA